jgi:hypothetical protein
MNAAEIWEWVWKTILALGGVGVVVGGFSAFFAKIFADRSIEKHKAILGQETERLKSELAKETETHKLQLKKQEILFNRQLDSVSEFIELHQKIMPHRNYPDKNWHDVREEVIEEFSKSETALEEYRRKFSAVLDADARKLLKDCIQLASNNKFAGMPDSDVGEQDAEQAVDKFLETLDSLEEHLLKQIRQ